MTPFMCSSAFMSTSARRRGGAVAIVRTGVGAEDRDAGHRARNSGDEVHRRRELPCFKLPEEQHVLMPHPLLRLSPFTFERIASLKVDTMRPPFCLL
jgi:hypothetical protein